MSTNHTCVRRVDIPRVICTKDIASKQLDASLATGGRGAARHIHQNATTEATVNFPYKR